MRLLKIKDPFLKLAKWANKLKFAKWINFDNCQIEEVILKFANEQEILKISDWMMKFLKQTIVFNISETEEI